MSTPPRRLSENADSFEATLLRAARAEKPRREGVRRTIAAASAVALSTCGATAVKVGAGGAKLSSWVAIAAGGVAIAFGIGAGVYAWTHVGDTPGSSVPASRPAPFANVATSPELVPPLPPIVTAVPVAPSPPLASAASAAGAASAASSTPTPRGGVSARAPASPVSSPPVASGDDELRLLRQAKKQVGAHDGPAAIETLDAHARAFPNGALAEEAAALRVEALVLNGETAKARRAAALFMERHPESPYTQRVRSAVGGP